MTWASRIQEVGTHRPRDVAWTDVWALIVFGQRHQNVAWIEDRLWAWRFADWVMTLDADRATCRNCGDGISMPTPLSRYCKTACRKMAYRRRENHLPTDFEALCNDAEVSLKEIQRDIARAHRTLRRLRKTQHAFTFPPDLTRIDHLPLLPQRCGAGCERDSACHHTEGSICLFAATGEIREDS